MFRRSILKILGGSMVLPALFSTAVTAGDMPAPFDNPGAVPYTHLTLPTKA